jgi:hypothetical protein
VKIYDGSRPILKKAALIAVIRLSAIEVLVLVNLLFGTVPI